MTALSSPLVRRIALAVFLAIIFIEIVILIPSYLNFEKQIVENLSDRSAAAVTVLFPKEEIPQTELSTLAVRLTQTPVILGYTIRKEGAILHSGGEVPSFEIAGPSLPAGFPTVTGRPGTIDIRIPDGFHSIAYGVDLRLDISGIPKELQGFVLRISGLVVIISVFVTAVTMLVLWIFVLRPIVTLRRQMVSAEKNWSDAELTPIRLSHETEVGDLFQAFNDLLSEIREAHQETQDIARFPSENPNPIMRLSKDGKRMYANEAAFGYPNLFGRPDVAEIPLKLKTIADAAYRLGRNQNHILADGKASMALSLTPVPANAYINIYGRDISEQKQAEEKLRETLAGMERAVEERTAQLVQANEELERQIRNVADAEQRFRLFADSAADYYWEMDETLRFSFFSERFSSVTGVSVDFLLGKTREETGNPGVADTVWSQHLSDLSAYRPFRNFVHPRTKPDGETVYLQINGIPVFDAEGVFQGYKGTGIDVTVLHSAQEELERAKEAAELTARTRSDFLATMSHEIRTPMNGVLGVTELLLDCDLDEEQEDLAQSIFRSATSLLSILNDILDVSKFESENMALESVSFSLQTLLDDLIEVIAPQSEEKHIQFGGIVDPMLPDWITGDPTRLRQILLNLAGNAVKFTQKGEVTIQATQVEKTAETATIRFEVTDTGIGIREEDIGYLFDTFKQADNSITRRFGGTGLGLSICRRLVEMMGSSIQVESTFGEGSRFFFEAEFPIAERRKIDRSSIQSPHWRTLVVDDNETNTKIFEGFLSKLDMPFVSCDTPTKALGEFERAAMAGQPFDLVITDYSMPEIDGLSFARRIRARDDSKSVKIILASSVTFLRSIDEDLEGLIDHRLLKPLRRRTFEEAISGLAEPLPDEAPQVAPPIPGPPPLAPQLDSLSDGLKILLVEDNPTNQMLGARLLDKAGHRSDLAENGEEAVEAAGIFPYDIILMDIHMPVMDGFQASEIIRKTKGVNQSTPIIALTADVMESVRTKCRAVGINDLLLKPYSYEDLVKILGNWTTMSKGGQEELPEPEIQSPQFRSFVADEAIDETIVQRLLNLLGEDELSTLLDQFSRNAQKLEADINQAIDDPDAPESLVSAIHSLSGASRSVGFRKLAELCGSMEKKLRQGEEIEPESFLQDLRQEVSRAVGLIDPICDSLNS